MPNGSCVASIVTVAEALAESLKPNDELPVRMPLLSGRLLLIAECTPKKDTLAGALFDRM
jgi:hypothetical protein